MSAFICTDKHFAVIAKHLFPDSEQRQQFFADHLKRENIASVNWRYAERTRRTKCNLSHATDDDVRLYTIHDILQLLECVDYQSCEHPDYDDTQYALAKRLLQSLGADSAQRQPGLWCI